jgi:hypothetical protein
MFVLTGSRSTAGSTAECSCKVVRGECAIDCVLSTESYYSSTIDFHTAACISLVQKNTAGAIYIQAGL